MNKRRFNSFLDDIFNGNLSREQMDQLTSRTLVFCNEKDLNEGIRVRNDVHSNEIFTIAKFVKPNIALDRILEFCIGNLVKPYDIVLSDEMAYTIDNVAIKYSKYAENAKKFRGEFNTIVGDYLMINAVIEIKLKRDNSEEIKFKPMFRLKHNAYEIFDMLTFKEAVEFLSNTYIHWSAL